MFLQSQLAAIGGYKFDRLNTRYAKVSGDGELLINPVFWDKLNATEKDFLLDHEVMHLVLKHHSRFEYSRLTGEALNAALDLSINSILYDQYVASGDPTKIIPTLWSVGVFPQKHKQIPCGKSAEFYVELLSKNMDARYSVIWNSPMLSDGSIGNKKLEEILDKVGSGCGFDQSEFSQAIKLQLKAGNMRFTDLMKELVGQNTRMSTYSKQERWTYNRRMPWANLPSEVYIEQTNKARKNKIGLFLDFSGSCAGLRDIFLETAALIPKAFYNVTLFKFAVKVAYLNENAPIGMGTSFAFIPVFEKDFDQIWLFTDGDAECPPATKSPNKWRWFLDGHDLTTKSIPKGSNIHLLNTYKR